MSRSSVIVDVQKPGDLLLNISQTQSSFEAVIVPALVTWGWEEFKGHGDESPAEFWWVCAGWATVSPDMTV